MTLGVVKERLPSSLCSGSSPVGPKPAGAAAAGSHGAPHKTLDIPAAAPTGKSGVGPVIHTLPITHAVCVLFGVAVH